MIEFESFRTVLYQLSGIRTILNLKIAITYTIQVMKQRINKRHNIYASQLLLLTINITSIETKQRVAKILTLYVIFRNNNRDNIVIPSIIQDLFDIVLTFQMR